MSELNEGARCLLLMLDNSLCHPPKHPVDDSPLKGYTLLPEAFINNHPEVVEYFSRLKIPVLNFESVHNYSLQSWFYLLEAKVYIKEPKADNEPESSCSFPSVRVCVYYCRGTFSFMPPKHWEMSDAEDIRYTEPMSEEYLDVISEFLIKNARIDYCHHHGGNIIDFAVRRHQIDLLKQILELYYFVRDDDYGRGLNLAIRKDSYDIAKLIVDEYNVLEDALKLVFGEDTAMFERLVKFGRENDSSFDDDILHKYFRKVVETDHRDVFDVILSHRPDVRSEFNKTTFHIAFLHHERDPSYKYFYEKMKDYGFRIDYSSVESRSLLLLGAIMNNWVDVVQKVIEAGVDVKQAHEMPDCLGPRSKEEIVDNPKLAKPPFNVLHTRIKYTPLYVAVVHAREAVIKLLLDHDVSKADLGCRRLIHDAIQNGNIDGVKFLITSGVNVQHDPDLIHHMVKCRNSEMVKLLLLNRTPLSLEGSELDRLGTLAVAELNPQAMTNLFKLGAKLIEEFEFPFKWGETPQVHPELVRALRDYNFRAFDYDIAKKIACSMYAKAPYYSWQKDYFDHCQKVLRELLMEHFAAIGGRRALIQRLREDKFSTSFGSFSKHAVDHMRNCEREIMRLKSEKVGDADATFFGILLEDVYQLERYAKPVDYVETMNSGDYKKRFPIYASVLCCQFEKGARRKELLQRGANICSALIATFKELPDRVKEKIMKYLNNYNLEVLNYEFEQYKASSDKK